MKRLSLITYDVVRELCTTCRRERFHFVPMGAAAAPNGKCKHCAGEAEAADVSDTSIYRLVTEPNGEVVVVPMIAKRP